MGYSNLHSVIELYSSFAYGAGLVLEGVDYRLDDPAWPASRLERKIAEAVLSQANGLLARFYELEKMLLRRSGTQTLASFLLQIGTTQENRDDLDLDREFIIDSVEKLGAELTERMLRIRGLPSVSPRVPEQDQLSAISENIYAKANRLLHEWGELGRSTQRNPVLTESLRQQTAGLHTELSVTETVWLQSIQHRDKTISIPELPRQKAIPRLLRLLNFAEISVIYYELATAAVEEMKSAILKPVVQAKRHGLSR